MAKVAQVFDVFLVSVFDSKVINHEGKGHIPSFVCVQTICVGFVITMFAQKIAKVIMSWASGFFESAPRLAHFGTQVIVVNKIIKVVVLANMNMCVSSFRHSVIYQRCLPEISASLSRVMQM